MSFYPVLPTALLLIIAAALLAIRMAALYRLLLRTGTGRYRRVAIRWSGLTAAVILLLLAAFRPGFDNDRGSYSVDLNPVAKFDPNLNVFFVVDRSVNSRVEDFGDGKSRMSGIRADIHALIDEYPHARFSVISFASKASVDWPLSDDAWSLQSMVDGLSPYTLVAPDTVYQVDPAIARDLLVSKVKDASATYSGSKSLVFYFGEGAAGSRVPTAPLNIDRDKVAGGAVLGYGTLTGGPIPAGWVDGTKAYQSDPSGNGAALNSSIDETRLKNIAAQLDVPYFHRESGQPISGVLPPVDHSAAVRHDGHKVTAQLLERREMYWVFTLTAAVLLLIEIALTIREYRRNRMSRRDVAR